MLQKEQFLMNDSFVIETLTIFYSEVLKKLKDL